MPADGDVCHLPWPRKPAGFKRLLSRLGTAFKMSEAQKEALKSLYVDAEPVESSKNLKRTFSVVVTE